LHLLVYHKFLNGKIKQGQWFSVAHVDKY